MSHPLLRIATRKSALALWQAEHVANRLTDANPGLSVELVGMTTRGDRILHSPLAKIGGKGLFVKELERGILEGSADIAVHSMKDVPMRFPAGLHLPVILGREDPRDAFVSARYPHPDAMPNGAVIGSSSLRRQCQMLAHYPHLQVRMLRGNVNTRLAKLDAGEFDAVILAVAGLLRLGFEDRIRFRMEPELSLPAIGQGAIGIECRADDGAVNALVSALDDPPTHVRVAAERAFNRRLEGSCQTPIAGYAEVDGQTLRLRGLVGRPDGSELVVGERSGALTDAESIGIDLAEELLGRGAGAILAELALKGMNQD